MWNGRVEVIACQFRESWRYKLARFVLIRIKVDEKEKWEMSKIITGEEEGVGTKVERYFLTATLVGEIYL